MVFSTSVKATCWSLTINNPEQSDEDNIQEARLKGWKVEGQKERGEEGTEHYQLMLKTPQVRGSAVKKQFPRAHIEVARNTLALSKYVHKEDTRVEELKNDDKYPSPTKLMGLFQQYCDDEFKAISNKYKHAYHDLPGAKLLEVFDDCIRYLISSGYYVEAYGVNPQIRSSIKNYGQQIILREKNNRNIQNAEKVDEQENDEEGSSSLPEGEDSEVNSDGRGHDGEAV